VKAEQVTVRPNGKIRGDINAQAVHVYGEVHGLIRAQSVHLYSSCHVEGVIIHHSLSVEDGAFIDGKFKRTQEKTLGDMKDEDSMSDNGDGFDESLPNNAPGSLRLIG
jgi:cytoskeletal protein CcmA (bactofilin family)